MARRSGGPPGKLEPLPGGRLPLGPIGRGHLVQLPINDGQVVPGGRCRIDGHAVFQRAAGVVIIACPGQQHAEIVGGHEVVSIDQQCGLEEDDRLRLGCGRRRAFFAGQGVVQFAHARSVIEPATSPPAATASCS